MSGDADRRWLLAALLLAVALRAEYLRELLATPFGRHVVLDGVFYQQAARHILDGNPLLADPGCFRAPLYPFFLALLQLFFPGSLLAPRVVQLLLGVVTVLVVRGIARRTHGEREANVAGVLAAAYGMFIYHEAEILGVSLGVLLGSGAVLLLLEAGRRPALRWTAGAGALLGLAALTHGTVLALAPVMFFWLLLARRRAEPRARLAGRLAVLTLAVTVPVSLATLRNALVTGDFVLLATQGGINFYVGNNAEADGATSLVPGRLDAAHLSGEYRDLFEAAARSIAERERGAPLSASEVSSFWVDRALRWMRAHPGDAARLMVRKAALFWMSQETSNNRDLEDQARRFTPILGPFLKTLGVILPFALLGLVFRRGRSAESSLVWGSILAYFVAVTAFFVCARFRQPAIALLLPYAASGLLLTVDSVRALLRGERRPWLPLAVLPLLAWATNASLASSGPRVPFHRYNLAVLLETDGDLAAAEREYRVAAAEHPEDPRIRLNRGRVLLLLGREAEGRDVLDDLAARAPAFSDLADGIVGSWAMEAGRFREAAARFEAITRRSPGNADAARALERARREAGS